MCTGDLQGDIEEQNFSDGLVLRGSDHVVEDIS